MASFLDGWRMFCTRSFPRVWLFPWLILIHSRRSHRQKIETTQADFWNGSRSTLQLRRENWSRFCIYSESLWHRDLVTALNRVEHNLEPYATIPLANYALFIPQVRSRYCYLVRKVMKNHGRIYRVDNRGLSSNSWSTRSNLRSTNLFRYLWVGSCEWWFYYSCKFSVLLGSS